MARQMVVLSQSRDYRLRVPPAFPHSNSRTTATPFARTVHHAPLGSAGRQSASLLPGVPVPRSLPFASFPRDMPPLSSARRLPS